MLENYINKNKNIIIVGGTKTGRQNFLVEAVKLININERIVIVEKAAEIPIKKLYNDNSKNRNIISIQTGELLIDREPQNSVAVSSIEDVSYLIKHVLPNSKYTIMACDKLIRELTPYADVVVQLKDDDTLAIIKEK